MVKKSFLNKKFDFLHILLIGFIILSVSINITQCNKGVIREVEYDIQIKELKDYNKSLEDSLKNRFLLINTIKNEYEKDSSIISSNSFNSDVEFFSKYLNN